MTISSVPSVEPSLTTIHFKGRTVCAIIDWIVSSMKPASFRAGVTTTYEGRFICADDDGRVGSCFYGFAPQNTALMHGTLDQRRFCQVLVHFTVSEQMSWVHRVSSENWKAASGTTVAPIGMSSASPMCGDLARDVNARISWRRAPAGIVRYEGTSEARESPLRVAQILENLRPVIEEVIGFLQV